MQRLHQLHDPVGRASCVRTGFGTTANRLINKRDPNKRDSFSWRKQLTYLPPVGHRMQRAASAIPQGNATRKHSIEEIGDKVSHI